MKFFSAKVCSCYSSKQCMFCVLNHWFLRPNEISVPPWGFYVFALIIYHWTNIVLFSNTCFTYKYQALFCVKRAKLCTLNWKACVKKENNNLLSWWDILCFFLCVVKATISLWLRPKSISRSLCRHLQNRPDKLPRSCSDFASTPLNLS